VFTGSLSQGTTVSVPKLVEKSGKKAADFW
jgi:hypothetical protein